ncbi:MAG TPA: riboflavin synthase subunit beta [Flavobacteriaceae bacterium]|mgnify:CR=1 FL=1|nr:riboflavin synthase subunit beta [Flavobacteriaceae bacterium]MCB9212437.1 riboflavin synthase subunit beta [Alteromonas sp.]HPF11713.1 riboflavin synthase subunit beta [Flavobacteriaceae bacterium]HQU20188.1 riboflavin synthase subunit beta [Flavobacteriaceae bacterium]HQU64723.1 riboflavin synthase subunit beta [Flavobacteriaceae bacterium]
MGIFTKRKNKEFSYSPRYYKSEKEGSPFSIEGKFDKYRRTLERKKGLKQRFLDAVEDFRENSDRKTNRTLLIIIAILLLGFLYLIDFDLSIFTQFP